MPDSPQRRQQPQSPDSGPRCNPPFARICRFCPKRFSKTEHLLRHERSHTKERPYHCKDCGKCFSRNDTLLRHARAHNKVPDDPVSGSDYGTPQELGDDGVVSAQLNLPIVHSQGIHQSQQHPENHATSLHSNEYSLNESRIQWHTTNAECDLGEMPPARTTNQETGNSPPHLQPLAFELSPLLDLWSRNSEHQYPSWHVGDDFDWEAFNMSLMAPISVDETLWKAPSLENQPILEGGPLDSTQSPSPAFLDAVQGLWVTKAYDMNQKVDGMSYSLVPTRPMTPNEMSPTTVDERYRDDLAKRLRPRWKEVPLPSTEFLNLALSLFFTRFNPIFPILHAPTFIPNKHNSLLLLSICSIGCLFMGSNGATAQGSKIFERLNKVILASWESILTRESPERTCMIQAALIGQTFGYLSGNPKHLATVESFHGTVISWARRDGMFKASKPNPPLNFQSPQELSEAWNTWARSEEKTRTAMGLYIHDAQLAGLFHHDPILRHNIIPLSVAASNELFSASSATQWAQLLRRCPPTQTLLRQHLHINHNHDAQRHPPIVAINYRHSRLSCYVILHGIEAAVDEASQTGIGLTNQQTVPELVNALTCWYQAYGTVSSSDEPDTFCLMILWHKIFMSLFVDFNALERAIGRDGSLEATSAQGYVNSWASSVVAKRCTIHASLINRQMGAMRVDAEPAIHIPRCMFLAAIAWYCYIKFGTTDIPAPIADESLDFPEFKALDINPEQYLLEVSGYRKGKPSLVEASPLCRLTDMLHKIGHWDIARKFAKILGLLIHGDTDSHLLDYP